MTTRSVILSGARTPFGKLNGGLASKSAVELGAVAIKTALGRATVDPADVGHVVMGQVLQGGAGQNPARQAAFGAGLAKTVTAETLNRVRLLVPRDRLPPPGDEDEFLLADLVGLSVETAAGEAIGTVAAVPNYGGGDLLEIAPAGGGPTALLPFTKAFVPLVDVAAGRIVVDAPADLFDDRKPDDEP